MEPLQIIAPLQPVLLKCEDIYSLLLVTIHHNTLAIEGDCQLMSVLIKYRDESMPSVNWSFLNEI